MTVEQSRLFLQYGVSKLSPQNQAVLTKKWNQILPTCTYKEYIAWKVENEGRIDFSILFQRASDRKKIGIEGKLYA